MKMKRNGIQPIFPRKLTSASRALFLSWTIGLGCILSVSRAYASSTGSISFDEEMENYKKTADSGEVRILENRLEKGTAQLTYEPSHGYLVSLLHELKVPPSSQLLVASKTSPNKALISPHNPRALYYNERVSVAYVPGAKLIELAAGDPNLGVVFYTLEQDASSNARLVRDDRCLECHASSKTLDVPGQLVRSFLTKNDGEIELLSGLMVNHRTPIAERWGGYYVTGLHGSQTHRGNIFAAGSIDLSRDPAANGNITDLKPFLDISKYPERGSDIVALMVLEHQAYMQTLLTRLAVDSRKALSTDDNLRSVYPLCEAVLKYMLFIGEAQLSAPVRGTSEFAEWFQHQGPRDEKGRSLRQLDLETRLFRYPCSYMIYSPSFAALPERVRRHLYRRLHEILLAEDTSSDFQTLSTNTRKAIYQILLDTVKELPVDWRLDGSFASSGLSENKIATE